MKVIFEVIRNCISWMVDLRNHLSRSMEKLSRDFGKPITIAVILGV
jgi:hypothetical protein